MISSRFPTSVIGVSCTTSACLYVSVLVIYRTEAEVCQTLWKIQAGRPLAVKSFDIYFDHLPSGLCLISSQLASRSALA